MLLKTIRGYIFYKRLLDLDTGKIYNADFSFNMYGVFVIKELPKEHAYFGMDTQIVKWLRYSDDWKWFYIDDDMIRWFKREILNRQLSSNVHRKAPSTSPTLNPSFNFTINSNIISINSTTPTQTKQNKNQTKLK